MNACRLGRQVVRVAVQGTQRGKGLSSLGAHQLVDGQGGAQVAQPKIPQAAQARPPGQLRPGDQLRRRAVEQDLPRMGSLQEQLRPLHERRGGAFRPQRAFPCQENGAAPGVRRCLRRRLGRGKGGAQGAPCRAQQPPPGRPDGLSQRLLRLPASLS